MKTSKELERIGGEAVRKLRENKLKHGYSFMIHSNELPSDQCYLEYLGGKIAVVTYSRDCRSFTELEELSSEEAHAIRKDLGFEPILK